MEQKKDKYTYIRVFKSTREDIKKLRIVNRETHDEVIKRLINFYLKAKEFNQNVAQ